MTTPTNQLAALLEHGNKQQETHDLERDNEQFNRLTLFLSNLKKRPLTEQIAFFDMLDHMNQASAKGEELPSLGSAAPTGGGVKPEYRNVIAALDNGSIKLNNRTGLPEQPEMDDSQVDDLLKPIEQSLGLNVAVSAPNLRRGAIMDEIGELKQSAGTTGGSGDGTNANLDTIGQQAGVKRKSREDDKAYAERVASVVGTMKSDLDQVVSLIEDNSTSSRKDGESVHDFLERAAYGSDAEFSTGAEDRRGGGFFNFGSRR